MSDAVFALIRLLLTSLPLLDFSTSIRYDNASDDLKYHTYITLDQYVVSNHLNIIISLTLEGTLILGSIIVIRQNNVVSGSVNTEKAYLNRKFCVALKCQL